MDVKNKEIMVVKRNGTKEKFDVEKINKVINSALKGIEGCSLSEIEINASSNYEDGIQTKEIHQTLINSCVNLISVERPNYQFVASKLQILALRKDVWGGRQPPRLLDMIKDGISLDIYTKDLLKWYTKSEINKINEYLDHSRDYKFTYAGIRQLMDKYLVQNRVTGQIYETPQFAYILIAMVCFHKYSGKERLNYIKEAYNAFSTHKINLPTPIMAGVRTNLKSFASCVLLDCDDSMNSIMATSSAIGHATSQRYGIGVNIGRIRPINSPIRNGEVVHCGLIPFLKVFQAMVKSCHQNSLRGGSANCTIPLWHYEIQDIIVLKNNAGTDDNRVRNLDYTVTISKLFYERFLKDENITLFSPHEAEGLYAAFGLPEFDEMYCKYEKDETLKFRKTVKARELFRLLMKERLETGRIYMMNIDNCNEHSSWLDKVDFCNLCVEYIAPCTPPKSLNDKKAYFATCILSSINLLEIADDKDLKSVCNIIVRLLDEIIDYQEYFAVGAKNFTQKRRSLGVGVTNLAALLAKNNIKYTDDNAPNFVDSWMEKIQYFLLETSCDLAKEKGKCEKFNKTKYSKGILPIDTYQKKIDSIVTRKLSMDWEKLRARIKEYGLRHSTLTAEAPTESSSIIHSSTNGIEPPRSLISYKTSKKGTLPVLVPGIAEFGKNYELAYDIKDNRKIINISCALQKYIDLGISTNFFYKYTHYENNTIPDSILMRDIIYHFSLGGKTSYYCNTSDESEDLQVSKEDNMSCGSGACSI